MKVFNTCCFKDENNSYLVCHDNWKDNEKDRNKLRRLIETIKCTDGSGNNISIKLHNYQRVICIEFENNITDIINIYTSEFELENILLHFPFEKAFLQYKGNNDINIISTMCRMYNFRLDEWIEYHLKLGVDGIVIFDNTRNENKNSNNKNDQDKETDMRKVTDKYGDKVVVIDFPYGKIGGNHWNTIQSVSLFTGLHAMKHKCKYITFTDADEFITVSNNDLRDFCKKNNKTIQICGDIVTNKSNNDKINNNVLELCKYVGRKSPSKMMVRTSDFLNNNPFFKFYNPHEIHGKNNRNRDIYMYHFWVNDRLKYTEDMTFIDLLNK
jgi:hypothetical protein